MEESPAPKLDYRGAEKLLVVVEAARWLVLMKRLRTAK